MGISSPIRLWLCRAKNCQLRLNHSFYGSVIDELFAMTKPELATMECRSCYTRYKVNLINKNNRKTSILMNEEDADEEKGTLIPE